MSRYQRKLSRCEQKLVEIIDWLAGVVEETTCTCPIEDLDNDIRNGRHSVPGRRRKDSAGVIVWR